MAAHLPQSGGSAVGRALNPDHDWTLEAQLLAATVDELRVLVWMKTTDAQKNRNHPEPIPRPGVTPKTDSIGAGDGFDTPAEFDAWYAAQFN